MYTYRPGPSAQSARPARLSALERLPTWFICIPLAIQWLWLGLRYRGLTLPSVANPALTAGGLVGEGKMEYFRSMGKFARGFTAPTCAIRVSGAQQATEIGAVIAAAGLSFPLIVKPDLGLCGYGVRKLTALEDLMAYLAGFPAGEQAVVQAYLAGDYEAGIFYARLPGRATGRIIGLAFRSYPRVVGDGERSIGALIAADPRARRVLRATHRLAVDPARVPAPGEVVRLAAIGSTRVGGLYRDGASAVTPALAATIDAIARDMPDFHIGRFDVRFASLDDLRAGRGFMIMEVNGAGSEAIQAWDPDLGLYRAFKIIFRKQRLLFAIGAVNRRLGHRPLGIRRLLEFHRRQRRLIAGYPLSS